MSMGRLTLGVGLAVMVTATVKVDLMLAQTTQPDSVDGAGNPIFLDERDVLIPLQPGTIPAAFNSAFFSNDRDYYTNRSIIRQLDYLFGTGILIRNGFPENEITRDGRAITTLYQEVLARQLFTGPIIRTPDLPSPFTTSVRDLPVTEAPLPPTVRPALPPVIEEVPATRPSVTPPARGPVPALW